MWVCPIISGQSLETGVGQRLDKGWTRVGQESDRGQSTEVVSCWMSNLKSFSKGLGLDLDVAVNLIHSSSQNALAGPPRS